METKKLNEKCIDILYHIHQHGKTNVRVSARELKQNKNFYFRVDKLEDMGLIIVERVSGEKSIFNLTEEGYRVLVRYKTNEANECLRRVGIQ